MFNKPNKKYAGRVYSKGADRGERGEKSVLHKAVCSDCGEACEVPFKPNGIKPVLCHSCFTGGEPEKAMHKTVCSKCGDSCEVPFKPSGLKPIFCQECFHKGGDDGVAATPVKSTNRDNTPREQFDILNGKLDRILAALTALNSAKPAASAPRAFAKKPPFKKFTKKWE